MTPEELAEQMQQLVDGTHPTQEYAPGPPQADGWRADPETGHRQADKLMVDALRALGYGAAMDVYEAQRIWYG